MVWNPAAEAKITGFLDTLRTAGLQFEYSLRRAGDSIPSQPGTADSETTPLTIAAASPEPTPLLSVDFTGPAAALMIERGGELLHAMESLAAGILRLEPEENDQVSFDALGFKQARDAATARTAQQGIDAVRATGKPFVYPPMNSRERRMLHLVLATSGLPTASSGDGPRRFVVVYPEGATPTPDQFNPPPTRRPDFSSRRGLDNQRGPGNQRAPASRQRSNSQRGPGSQSRPAGPRGPDSQSRPAGPRGPGSQRGLGNQPYPDRPMGEFAGPPTPPRLDPNGNPLEQYTTPETPVTTSEEERLATLRRAFRKR